MEVGRRKRNQMISGFPHSSATLPLGLQYEDIIKQYSNYLRGLLLLEIAVTWTARKISVASARPELTTNTMTKRIAAAEVTKNGSRSKSARRAKILFRAKV